MDQNLQIEEGRSKEARRRYDAAYHLAHGEKKRAASRAWAAEHRAETLAYQKQYREQKKAELAAKAKARREAEPERLASKNRAYFATHRDELLASNKRYRIERKSELRAKRRLATKGLTQEQYDALLEAQDRRCAICGTTDPGAGRECFAIDHDHATGATRALLCNHCNLGLGHFRDDPGRLLAAAAYLKQHAERSNGRPQTLVVL